MRRWGIAAIVVVLVALNVWRWWPETASVKPSIQTQHSSLSENLSEKNLRLAVRVSDSSTLPIVSRNVFERLQLAPPIVKLKYVPPPESTPMIEVLPGAQTTPPEPPPKTPEELEAEEARAEFAQIKLVGVILHDAKFRAYFAKGEQTYLASLGDAVARFTVTAIRAESVRLHDPRTQVGGEIPVLGK